MVARNRLVISGTLGSTETWSVGLNFAINTGGAVTDVGGLQTWAVAAAAVLDAGETDYSTLTPYMGPQCRATRVDVYAYGPTGPAIAAAGANFTWGGTGTRVNPYSTAMVFTLQTALAGASFRGRSYWPATGVTITDPGKLNVNQGAVAEFAELLEDMAGASQVPDMRPVVYSPTKNLITPVISVRLGDVPDHQRRRSENIPETFLVAPVVT